MKMTPEHKAKMAAAKKAGNTSGKVRVPSPARLIREKCLDCNTTIKMVKYCPCDGIHSRRCSLWPYRFGRKPASVAKSKTLGPQFVNPKEMPEANTPLDELP